MSTLRARSALFLASVLGGAMLVLAPLPFGGSTSHAQTSNPCAVGEVASQPDASGNVTCTDQSGSSYTVSASGAVQGGTNATLGNVNANGKPTDAGGSCSAFSPSTWFQNCIWIPLMSWLGSWFLTIGGGLLRLSGLLFDNLVYAVIVNFKGTLDAMGITGAINIGWTTFRDFTNIMIIGIFVFIALSIILGLKEYGQKKLIANVLIIAVLINFSLLFTKIVIDASNFTAYQIYKQMAGTASAGTYDIAGGFLKPMGITSVWDDTALVTAAVGQSTNSAMQAFFFGLVGGALLALAAGVIFYGCFLIMARAILFIFLMLTAALAFATYLIPSLSKGEYGWSAWWKALFNNAIFAPLLMLFLSVSLAIVNQAGGLNKGNGVMTLGQIIAHPNAAGNASAWTVVLAYIIGIGLLFASFKMASKFAGTISGFSLAGAAISGPLGAAFRGLTAGARVSTMGTQRQNMARSLKLDDRINTERIAAASGTGSYDRVLQLMKQKAEADKAAKTSFNPLSSELGKAIGKATFMPKSLLEKSKDNYADKANKIAAEAAKTGAAAVLSKNEAEKHVRGEVEKERENAHLELQERHAANEELLKAAKQMESSAKESAGISKSRGEQEKELFEANKRKVELNQEKQMGKLSEVEHQKEMRAQDDRIKKANERLAEIKSQENGIRDLHNVPALEKMAQQTKQDLDAFKRDIDKEVRARATKLVQGSIGVADKITMHEAEHHGDSTVVEIARKKLGGRIKNREAIAKHKLTKELDAETKET